MSRGTAPSDAALPPGVRARPLGDADLAAALALSQEAGWNQRAEDWRIFLGLGSATGLIDESGRLIASAATLPYDGGFAWISMVLVTAHQRRRGLARWLLRDCIDKITAQGLCPALDATPAGRAVYLGLGFGDLWGLQRLIARQPVLPEGVPEGINVRPLRDEDWPAVDALDAAVFGAQRGALLRRLARRLPAAALVAERAGALAGYLLGRDGRVMSQLGPLAAADEAIARALLSRAVATATAPFVIDLPDRHAALGLWLSGLGFAVERPYTRMVLGRDRDFGDAARLFAIAGPELG